MPDPKKNKRPVKLFCKVKFRAMLVKSRHATRDKDDSTEPSGKRQRVQKNKSYLKHV